MRKKLYVIAFAPTEGWDALRQRVNINPNGIGGVEWEATVLLPIPNESFKHFRKRFVNHVEAVCVAIYTDQGLDSGWEVQVNINPDDIIRNTPENHQVFRDAAWEALLAYQHLQPKVTCRGSNPTGAA